MNESTGSTVAKDIDHLVQLLADQEELAGKKRDNFVSLMRKGMSRPTPSDRNRTKTFLAAALCIAAGPFVANYTFTFTDPGLPTERERWIIFAIPTIVALAVLAGLWRRGRRQSFRRFKEEWADYCRNLRPMLLENEPTLLDRNLPAARPFET